MTSLVDQRLEHPDLRHLTLRPRDTIVFELEAVSKPQNTKCLASNLHARVSERRHSHAHYPVNVAATAAAEYDRVQDGPETQGQRPLNSFSGKDLRQEVVAPSATAAFHGDAFRPRMLFQKR